MTSLKQVVQENDTRHGRAFDMVIQVLIVLSAIGFAVETLPDLSARSLLMLQVAESVILGIFTIEYLLRLYVSEKKLAFVFSFYGLIDLLAILPFYLGLAIDLRSVRIFRLA
ncbi:MAG: ion transporter, partial [Arenicellales bacterium]